MFGMMRPPTEDLQYRAAYARCCQFQRHFYGMISLPVLSYDAVFLYLCGIDAGLVPEAVLTPQRCCRLRGGAAMDRAPDAAVGRFCGAISVLLADTKLQDDVRDQGGVVSRLARFVLRRPVARALGLIAQLEPAFPTLLQQWTAAQVAVEKDRTSLTLAKLVEPTAEAVAAVARLMPGAAHRRGLQGFLGQVGRHLGTAIVAADCALDWRQDTKTGNCNPVTNEQEAAASARLALHHLHQVVQGSELFFGQGARSATVGRLVYTDVARRLKQQCQLQAVDLGPTTHQQTGAVSVCVSLGETIGSSTRKLTHPSRAQEKKEPVECPRACQCGCQLLGGLLLLLGCADHRP
jgi:hypothetical protein